MKKSVVAAALAMTAAHGAKAPSGAEHLHVVRTGSLRVEAPPELAFKLFTAPGEKLWIDEWDPAVVSGDGLERGTVFITDIHETTIWIVVDFDREARHALYARVAPDSRAGTVEVSVDPDGDGGSIVRVSYELTGLSEAGNGILRKFDETSYAAMMLTWEQMIREANIDYASQFFAGL